jgi:putative FmdB family regulatory protein
MPLFEYKCRKCGHKVEFLERDSRATHHTCPHCGGKDLQKLFSTFSTGRSDSKVDGGGSCPTGTCSLG